MWTGRQFDIRGVQRSCGVAIRTDHQMDMIIKCRRRCRCFFCHCLNYASLLRWGTQPVGSADSRKLGNFGLPLARSCANRQHNRDTVVSADATLYDFLQDINTPQLISCTATSPGCSKFAPAASSSEVCSLRPPSLRLHP